MASSQAIMSMISPAKPPTHQGYSNINENRTSMPPNYAPPPLPEDEDPADCAKGPFARQSLSNVIRASKDELNTLI
ncbi:hypothetical protein ANCDUO_09024 [Ancylostoma duodenale]|uniref:Uncharacterized protein n=1 Tax=Ancylostoma duodenale TaxID=51022 RepID=A0A0C2GNP7_9BILA|nr:hypothetical protein ANCDUO_09024 [Ancylostoma duodenale]